MKKAFLKSLALTAVGSLCLAGSALALPLPFLEGGISMTGAFVPINDANKRTTIMESTGIRFVAKSFFVITATDGYESLLGTTGTFKKLSFDPQSTPSVALWRDGGFLFKLTSLTYEKAILSDDSHSISIFGEGIIRKKGFVATEGFWNFTGQGANNANFSWSASSASVSSPGEAGSAVPEPAAMVLIGTGLIGLAGVSARRNKTKSNQNDMCSGC